MHVINLFFQESIYSVQTVSRNGYSPFRSWAIAFTRFVLHISCMNFNPRDPGWSVLTNVSIRQVVPDISPSGAVRCQWDLPGPSSPRESSQFYIFSSYRGSLNLARVLKWTCTCPFYPRLEPYWCIQKICASILGNEWSPVLSVIAVCVTIQSMLASCKVCPVPTLSIWA